MYTDSPTLAKQITDKLTFNILVENLDQNVFRAIVLGFPNCQVEGNSQEEAITNVRQLLSNRLAKANIISLEIESPNHKHPWMQFAGIYANNPLFEEVLADIAVHRQETDIEREGYNYQADAKETAK